jgi:hypothetical protein
LTTRHRAYGLEIDAYIELPEFHAGDSTRPADVAIVASTEPLPDADRYRLQFEADEILFENDVLSMSVRGGCSVEVRAAAPHSAAVRQYVVGPGLAMILLQRGKTLLHGSGVVIDGKAAIFCADSGGGKSTFAAALQARGHALLTDDIAMIEAGGVVPSFPLLKLAAASAEAIAAPRQLLDVETDPDRRLRFHAPVSVAAASPLSVIFTLAKGESIATEVLRGSDAVMAVARAMYWHELVTGDVRRSLFVQASALAATVPVVRLVRPFDFASLGRLCEVVESVVATR